MLEIVYIVNFIVDICIGNKYWLVWVDTIGCYVGTCIGVVLVEKLR